MVFKPRDCLTAREGRGEGPGPSGIQWSVPGWGVARRWEGSQVCGPRQPWEKCLGRERMLTASLLPLNRRRPCPPRNQGVRGSPLSLRASWPLVPQVRNQPPTTCDVTSDVLSWVTQQHGLARPPDLTCRCVTAVAAVLSIPSRRGLSPVCSWALASWLTACHALCCLFCVVCWFYWVIFFSLMFGLELALTYK